MKKKYNVPYNPFTNIIIYDGLDVTSLQYSSLKKSYLHYKAVVLYQVKNGVIQLDKIN